MIDPNHTYPPPVVSPEIDSRTQYEAEGAMRDNLPGHPEDSLIVSIENATRESWHAEGEIANAAAEAIRYAYEIGFRHGRESK